MPSQRKRIGFLPSSKIQKIIDEICIQNSLSQSKVTGILVEEALNSRGILKSTVDKLSKPLRDVSSDEFLISNVSSSSETHLLEDRINLDNDSIRDEVQMINDFIEFKFFKNIMNKNKKNLNN